MRYHAIVYVFVITALWDVVLRFLAEGKFTALGVEKMKWVVVLKEYFEAHTLLAAALIAGFVGAFTLVAVDYTVPRAINAYHYSSIDVQLYYVAFVALVSGLIGFPMKYSGLFPELKKYYYDRLGTVYSFMSDAFSGIVVTVTYGVILYLNAYIKNHN